MSLDSGTRGLCIQFDTNFPQNTFLQSFSLKTNLRHFLLVVIFPTFCFYLRYSLLYCQIQQYNHWHNVTDNKIFRKLFVNLFQQNLTFIFQSLIAFHECINVENTKPQITLIFTNIKHTFVS